MPEHAVDWKNIAKTQKVSFAKIQNLNHAQYLFEKHCVIHEEFVPEGQTVNSAFYVEVMKRSLKRISRIRPQKRVVGSCCIITHLLIHF